MSNTVMVIHKDSLANLLLALKTAGLEGWIGTAQTLRQSKDGHYVTIHDWSQCANDTIKAKVATLLQIASETAGVQLITELDMAQGEKILKDWPNKSETAWVEKQTVTP